MRRRLAFLEKTHGATSVPSFVCLVAVFFFDMTSQAEGDTALYVAAKAGHDEAVRALLQVPVTKVNWQNHKGTENP